MECGRNFTWFQLRRLGSNRTYSRRFAGRGDAGTPHLPASIDLDKQTRARLLLGWSLAIACRGNTVARNRQPTLTLVEPVGPGRQDRSVFDEDVGHLTHRSSRAIGLSTSCLIRWRKRAAGAPSTIRWSKLRLRVTIGRTTVAPVAGHRLLNDTPDAQESRPGAG